MKLRMEIYRKGREGRKGQRAADFVEKRSHTQTTLHHSAAEPHPKPTTEALRHGENTEKPSCTAEARRRGEEFDFDKNFEEKKRFRGTGNARERVTRSLNH